jgi:hypothetical protein
MAWLNDDEDVVMDMTLLAMDNDIIIDASIRVGVASEITTDASIRIAQTGEITEAASVRVSVT